MESSHVSMVCTGTHTVTQADLTAGSFYDNACADASGATQVCDDDTVNGNTFTSLALGTDGVPIVGFGESSTGRIVVARMPNA